MNFKRIILYSTVGVALVILGFLAGSGGVSHRISDTVSVPLFENVPDNEMQPVESNEDTPPPSVDKAVEEPVSQEETVVRLSGGVPTERYNAEKEYPEFFVNVMDACIRNANERISGETEPPYILYVMPGRRMFTEEIMEALRMVIEEHLRSSGFDSSSVDVRVLPLPAFARGTGDLCLYQAGFSYILNNDERPHTLYVVPEKEIFSKEEAEALWEVIEEHLRGGGFDSSSVALQVLPSFAYFPVRRDRDPVPAVYYDYETGEKRKAIHVEWEGVAFGCPAICFETRLVSSDGTVVKEYCRACTSPLLDAYTGEEVDITGINDQIYEVHTENDEHYIRWNGMKLRLVYPEHYYE